MAYFYRFKAGDRVRIASQPPNQIVPLIGEVGVIEEIDGDFCNVSVFSLEPDSNLAGSGTVPLGCLEPFQSPVLKSKLAARQRILDETLVIARARQESWTKLVTETAERFKLDADVVEEIMDIGRSWS